MAPPSEESHLKRLRAGTVGDEPEDAKKPRRFGRPDKSMVMQDPDITPKSSAVAPKTPISNKQCPSPVTVLESISSFKERTVTPTDGGPSQINHHTPEGSQERDVLGLSSPGQLEATQPFSQSNPATFADEVKDEEAEGVWGYLLPLNNVGSTLVLRKRDSCITPAPLQKEAKKRENNGERKDLAINESAYGETKVNGVPSGGYLIGRHPECDMIINRPGISNRHCLLFTENKTHDTLAFLEDLSMNGTFVNEALIGRNKRRELQDQDEISFQNDARFIFRYPKHHQTSSFLQQYTILSKLGKGHFAEVYLCVEKSTGTKYAVKIFTKSSSSLKDDHSKTEGLQQEIAVLMSVSHPNMLCLKDTFDEEKAVYLVLELAVEGELFNWIVMKQKLTEEETRKVFIQLFQGVKYLHDRGIVHRDIKPENILLKDRDLYVKLADFGLAKIIGEESFTTTLCGTPSYVAPEILEDSKNRRYTRAVDIWSLGVVLYICLCGFPPFSDELNTTQSPYTLSQQIKMGRFDYPSPYWDSVGDPALDLIDRMLAVDPEKRYTVDQCLEHPWTRNDFSGTKIGLNDSMDGLPGEMMSLDFSKRKVARERTLLATLNDIHVSEYINFSPTKDGVAGGIKILEKNPKQKVKKGKREAQSKGREVRPEEERNPEEFVSLGGKGDEPLFGHDADSNYTPKSVNAGGGKRE